MGTITRNNKSWSYREKRQLYKALLRYGSSNTKLLAAAVPTRSESAIGSFMKRYEQLGQTSLDSNNTIRKGVKYVTKLNKVGYKNIDKWLEYVHDRCIQTNNSADISTALKFIQLFEPHSEQYGVNFRECYQLLATILRGNVPLRVNRKTSLFLQENLQALMRNPKYSNNANEKRFLLTLRTQKQIRSYGLKTRNQSAAKPILHTINPLKIPEHLLTKTINYKITHIH